MKRYDWSRLSAEELRRFDDLVGREDITEAEHQELDELEAVARVSTAVTAAPRRRWGEAGSWPYYSEGLWQSQAYSNGQADHFSGWQGWEP